MGSVVILEWKFAPLHYFEEPITIIRNDYTMTIADGVVTANIDGPVYESDPSIRQRLHNDLNDRFLGVQLLTHQAFELSKATITRVHPDGRRDIFIELEPARLIITGGSVDFLITDKDGNVISDSRKARVERKKDFAELIAKHRPTNPLLNCMLNSYHAAVRDPNNELVYLYEIRDAVSSQFGDEANARKILDVSSSQWSRMGLLCNNEPLRQGRHRGKTRGELRDASEAELMEVRGIVRAIIEGYLGYLESSA
jgi:hypothetical protein